MEPGYPPTVSTAHSLYPDVFFDYYVNYIVALASRAWFNRLGPNNQVTSAVNIVNPGGQRRPRIVTTTWVSCRWRPRRTTEHVHRLSPLLTQQGAVAHCDMPVQTGPTI